jgi:WW domain-binding protein 4
VWSDYTTAQSLGYTDPEEDRRKAEIALRQTQGIVGKWQVVVPPPPPLPEEEQDVKDSKDSILSSDPLSSRKREAPLSIEDEDDARHFKLRRRTLAAGLDEIWDPGEIQVKPRSKPKEESLTPEASGMKSPSPTTGNSEAFRGPDDSTEKKPIWKPMKWKRVSGDLN